MAFYSPNAVHPEDDPFALPEPPPRRRPPLPVGVAKVASSAAAELPEPITDDPPDIPLPAPPQQRDLLMNEPIQRPNLPPPPAAPHVARDAYAVAAAKPLEVEKPKLWQRIAAGAAGGLAGYANASGKAPRIDAAPAVDALLNSGTRNKQAAQQRDLYGKKTAADLEEKSEQDATKTRESNSKLQTEETTRRGNEARIAETAARTKKLGEPAAPKPGDVEESEITMKGPDGKPVGKVVRHDKARGVYVDPLSNADIPFDQIVSLAKPAIPRTPPRDPVKSSDAQNRELAMSSYAAKLKKKPEELTADEQIAALKNFATNSRPPLRGQAGSGTGTGIGGAKSDVQLIADGITEGKQSPVLSGLYRNTGAVRAELQRRGYNHAVALNDWNSIQAHLKTMNGSQQERLRQAISFTSDSIAKIEDLYNQWQKVGVTSGWKAFNKASLATAKQLPGEAGAIASNLETQIADLTSELGTVYKGGNGSTDESLRLAGQNLSADWNEATFKRAVSQLRQNLQIRRNSILTSAAVGVSKDSPYVPGGGEGSTGNNGPVGKTVKMIAPTGETMDVPEAEVSHYLQRGATKVPEKKPETKK